MPSHWRVNALGKWQSFLLFCVMCQLITKLAGVVLYLCFTTGGDHRGKTSVSGQVNRTRRP